MKKLTKEDIYSTFKEIEDHRQSANRKMNKLIFDKGETNDIEEMKATTVYIAHAKGKTKGYHLAAVKVLDVYYGHDTMRSAIIKIEAREVEVKGLYGDTDDHEPHHTEQEKLDAEVANGLKLGEIEALSLVREALERAIK